MKVRDIMTSNPCCCLAGDALVDAARIMRDCDTGFVPVVDEKDRPIGVLTDRDIAIRVVAEGKELRELTIGQAMTHDVFCCGPDDRVDDVLRQMEERKIRRCLVIGDDGKVIGVLSPADVATRDNDVQDNRQFHEMLDQVSQTQRSARHDHPQPS